MFTIVAKMAFNSLLIALVFLLKTGVSSPCGRKECDTCVNAAEAIPHWSGSSVLCDFVSDN